MKQQVLLSWEVDGGSSTDVIKRRFLETEISEGNASLVIPENLLEEARLAFSKVGIDCKELAFCELNVCEHEEN